MSGGQDWAAEVHRDMDNPVDTPNLAHRTSVLRRELAKERRATESAVELLRVVASEQISTSGAWDYVQVVYGGDFEIRKEAKLQGERAKL